MSVPTPSGVTGVARESDGKIIVVVVVEEVVVVVVVVVSSSKQ